MAIGHGPCSATPLQPPPRYLLALALLRALPESAAGFATLAIYEQNIARSRIKRPIKIESSDRVKIDSAGPILAPSYIPRMQLKAKVNLLTIFFFFFFKEARNLWNQDRK